MKKLIGLLALSLISFSVSALEAPKGKPLLTVLNSDIKNSGDTAVFDSYLFNKLKPYSFSTKSPWFSGVHKFEGVKLSDFYSALKIKKSDQLIIEALDGYKITIPASDAWDEDVMIVNKINNKVLTPRDKGPFFIVYNFDSKSYLNSDKYYSRCPWQIKKITVVKK